MGKSLSLQIVRQAVDAYLVAPSAFLLTLKVLGVFVPGAHKAASRPQAQVLRVVEEIASGLSVKPRRLSGRLLSLEVLR